MYTFVYENAQSYSVIIYEGKDLNSKQMKNIEVSKLKLDLNFDNLSGFITSLYFWLVLNVAKPKYHLILHECVYVLNVTPLSTNLLWIQNYYEPYHVP